MRGVGLLREACQALGYLTRPRSPLIRIRLLGRGLNVPCLRAQAAQRHARQEAASLAYSRLPCCWLPDRTGGKAAEVGRGRITAAGPMALADAGREHRVAVLRPWWLPVSRP